MTYRSRADTSAFASRMRLALPFVARCRLLLGRRGGTLILRRPITIAGLIGNLAVTLGGEKDLPLVQLVHLASSFPVDSTAFLPPRRGVTTLVCFRISPLDSTNHNNTVMNFCMISLLVRIDCHSRGPGCPPSVLCLPAAALSEGELPLLFNLFL